MGWADTAIFWHVYPLGFVGAPPVRDVSAPPVPRLRRLTGWLDHLVELGANGLLLGPVFTSETHGYDTVDHFSVDPRLGTQADLDDLFEQASGRGVRVVLDGVFNHVGRGFPALADVLERGEGSPYASWFRRRPDGSLDTFEGHDRLVALNHDEPQVVDHVVDVMTHWLDRGASGWRLDAAYAVPPTFWREVTGRVRARHPDAWLLAEVIHGDYAAFVAGSGVDSVTQYELWKAIWSSLNDANFYELAWALDRHGQLLDEFTPQTFVGNHDVSRIASQLDDPRHAPHALAVLMTVAGVPSIFAGDEVGLLGVKEHREGGDDAVRPEFPDSPADLDGRADVLDLHRELIALRRRYPWLVRARTSAVHLDNTRLVLRSTDGSQALLTALSLEDGATELALPGPGWRAVAGHGAVDGARLSLAPHGWCVLAADG